MESFQPRNEDEIRDVVRWAAAEGAALRIAGSDSRAHFGHRVAAAHGLRLDGLRGIIAYDPRELVLTAAAGTPMAEIHAALGAQGQALAFEPPGTGTLGGVFLANHSGPRRVHAGAARDHLLGVRAVNGRGEIWKAGGRVIKNVTGYDLPRLLAGSWGTLAVVTEITCKVLPAAPATRTLAIGATDTKEACVILQRVAATALGATGLAHVPHACAGAPASLRGQCLVRVEGTPGAVDERLRLLRELPGAETATELDCTTTWPLLRDATPLAGAAVLVRAAVPPALAPALCAWLEARGAPSWFLDCAGAWIWIGLPEPGAALLVTALRAEIAGRGAVVIVRAPDTVKDAAGVLTAPPPALAALNMRLRQAFDPLGLFNPGRLSPH